MLYNLSAIIKFSFFYLIGLLVGMKIKPPHIYLICGISFLAGFVLRIAGSYPGRYEPPIIDFATFSISAVLFFLSVFYVTVPLKFGLSLIISLHIIYNLTMIFRACG